MDHLNEFVRVLEDFWIPVLCPLILLFLVIAEFRKK